MSRRKRSGKPTQRPADGALAASPLAAVPRQPWLDALRGTAVLMMIAYHFGYDLNFLGWVHQDLNHDLRWMAARGLILGSFLFSVGASHALAVAQAVPAATRWRHIGKIAGAAILVTGGSWLLFPQSAIWFGTLHAIAIMSALLIALHELRLGTWPALLLGIAAIATGNLVAHPLFDHPALAWIGLMTHAPFTEDYVPLLPWFGVCLIGYGAMSLYLRRPAPRPPGARLPPWLLWLGRHSLAIYLLHQPILLGILMPLTRWLKTS